jgi:ribosomal protein L29
MIKKNELLALRKKELVELLKMVEEKKLKMAKARTEITAGREKNLKAAKHFATEIAKILTVVREKELSVK